MIKNIGIEDIEVLEHFLTTIGKSGESFRYFEKRPTSVIEQHLVTLLMYDSNKEPIGYGHLDPEDGNVWLGVCVADKQRGKGIGDEILSKLLSEADNLGIHIITLSVDQDNKAAISLYIKYGFALINQSNNVCIFERRENPDTQAI